MTKVGFIVMDKTGTLFGTLTDNTNKEVLHKFSVQLPVKHGRGKVSDLAAARLRSERHRDYVAETAHLAKQLFIDNVTNQPNVTGLVLAGAADFKTVLSQSELFDERLKSIVLSVADVYFGGEVGFDQAIQLSAPLLSNLE